MLSVARFRAHVKYANVRVAATNPIVAMINAQSSIAKIDTIGKADGVLTLVAGALSMDADRPSTVSGSEEEDEAVISAQIKL